LLCRVFFLSTVLRTVKVLCGEDVAMPIDVAVLVPVLANNGLLRDEIHRKLRHFVLDLVRLGKITVGAHGRRIILVRQSHPLNAWV
jgi:hypothetical protein